MSGILKTVTDAKMEAIDGLNGGQGPPEKPSMPLPGM